MLKTLGIAAAGAAIVAAGVTATASPSPALNPTASAPTSPVGATQHDNVVDLVSANSLPVSFAWDQGYSITAGQPWGGVTTSPGLAIDVEAGRSASTGPAQWLNDRTAVPVGTEGAGPGGSGPSELNFAFSGTLTIDGHEYPIVMGQGHTGDNNNWWFGGQGSGWKGGVSGPTVGTSFGYVTTPDGLYSIGAPAGFSNQFGVTPASLNN